MNGHVSTVHTLYFFFVPYLVFCLLLFFVFFVFLVLLYVYNRRTVHILSNLLTFVNLVRVECTPSDMLVSLSLANDFRGRIYATGNPQACFELGTGQSDMTLRIPLGTECGTVQQV